MIINTGQEAAQITETLFSFSTFGLSYSTKSRQKIEPFIFFHLHFLNELLFI